MILFKYAHATNYPNVYEDNLSDSIVVEYMMCKGQRLD